MTVPDPSGDRHEAWITEEVGSLDERRRPGETGRAGPAQWFARSGVPGRRHRPVALVVDEERDVRPHGIEPGSVGLGTATPVSAVGPSGAGEEQGRFRDGPGVDGVQAGRPAL